VTLTYARKEFPNQVKRDALMRSRGLCEGIGTTVNLPPGVRCNVDLGKAVQFDHVDAIDNQNVSLSNIQCLCVKCHAWKTAKIDIPKHAKVKRISDKHNGIRKPKKPWPSRKFNQPRYDNARYVERT
jgi:5-methylcytosine-specific restriction protein A